MHSQKKRPIQQRRETVELGDKGKGVGRQLEVGEEGIEPLNCGETTAQRWAQRVH